MDWDVFISHASEDKESFARPLAKALEAQGLRVWFDEFTLRVGDRLRRSIDHGLSNCQYGIVILSPHFFGKEWPQNELDGLVQRESRGENVILPVWHNVTVEQIQRYSLTLADRVAVLSSRGLDLVVAELLLAMRWTGTEPIRLELVRVPAGEFLMGSDSAKDALAWPNEQPQHRLVLPEIHIGKYPITNEQYAVFVKAKGVGVPGHWEGSRIPTGKEHHPVVYVSWHDAVAFCDWLSQVSGRTVRLPTEAEWEKAARGEDERIWPWGNEWDATRLNSRAAGLGSTTPVGEYSPGGDSPYGCADMAGNVWEWCSSLYRPCPYDADDGRENPKAPHPRVLRGGAFCGGSGGVRCAVRLGIDPDYCNRDFGFRVVSSPVNS